MNNAEKNELIKRYKRSENLGIQLIDLDATALAGHYLLNYPGDPIGALLIDINNLEIPSTVGQTAKIIISAVISQDIVSLE